MYSLRRTSYSTYPKTTLTMVADLPPKTATNAHAAAIWPYWSFPLVMYQTIPRFGAKIGRKTTKIGPTVTKAVDDDPQTTNRPRRLLHRH